MKVREREKERVRERERERKKERKKGRKEERLGHVQGTGSPNLYLIIFIFLDFSPKMSFIIERRHSVKKLYVVDML